MFIDFEVLSCYCVLKYLHKGFNVGFQFLHIESYSRKAGKGKTGGNSVSDIIAEVTRKPDASPHVPNPQLPTLVFGVDAHQLPAMCESYAVTMTNEFTRKNRKTGIEETVNRKMREDGLVMIGGVFSAPADMPVGDWPSYRKQMIEKLKNEFGDRLKSVNEHHDEPYKHCHFYVIPKPGEHFDQIHPGKRAAAAANDKGEVKGKQNTAYIESMRKWQDSYWKDVSEKFGLARIGPKVQRVSRSEWQAQQAALVLNAETLLSNTGKTNALKDREIVLKKQEIQVKQDIVKVKKLETFGGKLGLVFGGVVTAGLAIKDWLVERKLWAGVTREEAAKAKTRNFVINQRKELEKASKDLIKATSKVESLKNQLETVKAPSEELKKKEIELDKANAELAKVEGFNTELAIENNQLKRTLLSNKLKS